jgi:large subunit ribosomal protein L4
MPDKKKPASKAKPAPKAKAPGAPGGAKRSPEKRKQAVSPASKSAATAQDTAATQQPAGKAHLRSESPKVSVVNAANETVREIQLSPVVFGAKPADHLVYLAVKQHRAGGRAGTHATKNRALVSGSGKKPWRQKGTGRARVGETRNPLWRHGGTVFGPQPRDYSLAMPKKARAAALRAALSQRLHEGAVKVVEGFEVSQPKTKILKGLLATLGATGKAVVVDHQPTEFLVLSGRNLEGVRVVADSHLTAYDVMDCAHLVLSQDAIDKLEERLTPALRG